MGSSHYVRVKPIRTKDEASGILTEWITRLETETGGKVNFLRTDGGGEYMGGEFQRWLKSKGIRHELTNPSTPQENGMAERLNRTILEMMRSMMFDTKLPKSFRALTEKMTPFEALYKRKPSVAHMRIFGCPVYVHVPDAKRGKIVADSQNLSKVYISRDVTFLERPEEPERVRIQVVDEAP